MSTVRSDQKGWIDGILNMSGWNLTELARRSGVHQTTLTRFYNDPHEKALLTARTVARIADTTGWQPYARPTADNRRPPTTGDLMPIEPMSEILGPPIQDAIRSLIAGNNNAYSHRVETRALEGAGFLPGDIVVIDMSADPRPGDAVSANVQSPRGYGGESTVLRLFQPPHLVAATFDRISREVFYVDNERVRVMGVVIGLFRPRLAASAANH